MYYARFSRLMIMCACVSRVRTTWSASACSASTAPLPLSPPHPPCSGPSIPSQACAAAAQPDLLEITARLKLTCVTQTPAWMEECVLAGREATPASAERITQVRVGLCVSVRDVLLCLFRCWGVLQMLARITHFAVYSGQESPTYGWFTLPKQTASCQMCTKAGYWMYSRMMRITTVMFILPKRQQLIQQTQQPLAFDVSWLDRKGQNLFFDAMSSTGYRYRFFHII